MANQLFRGEDCDDYLNSVEYAARNGLAEPSPVAQTSTSGSGDTSTVSKSTGSASVGGIRQTSHVRGVHPEGRVINETNAPMVQPHMDTSRPRLIREKTDRAVHGRMDRLSRQKKWRYDRRAKTLLHVPSGRIFVEWQFYRDAPAGFVIKDKQLPFARSEDVEES